MKDGPAFQLYASDFYMDTAGWTPTQVGIYFRLLMYEWVNGSIPNTNEERARVAGIDPGNMSRCWGGGGCPTLEGKFSPNGDGNLINKRLEEVRQNQRKYRESQKEKGKHGAEKRWRDKMAGGILQPQPKDKPEDSSSSLSSSSLKEVDLKEQADAPFTLPSKEEIQEASDPMILDQIQKVCLQLYQEKIFFKVYVFKNKMLKNKNPRSILHTLCRAYIKREFEKGPWAYCRKIIEIEEAKYNARDYGKTL